VKRLIYQVYVGKKSKLYDHCVASVKAYCEKYGIDHEVQKTPILMIKPDLFSTNRNPRAWEDYGGFMPIFEKENVFDHFKDYELCCVIDADIYIRPTAPDIFEDFDQNYAVGSVYECDLPINNEYAQKINSYSRMLSMFQLNWDVRQRTGYSFFNSGVMMYNSNKMLKILKGMTPKEFLDQYELQDFINGVGLFKWQSDQMTLNYWFKKNKVSVQRMDWKWNCLYTTVSNGNLKDSHFVHFFLRDKLPSSGENVDELRKLIE